MTVTLNTIILPGYRILEEVYLGSRTVVYKGIREKDQLPVIIKLMRNEYPTFNEVAQFRNQYTITKNLNLPGVIKTYSLENYRNGYALVIEDFGGVSLQDIRKLLNQQESSGNLGSLKSKQNNHTYLSSLLEFNNKFDFISCFLHIAIAVTAALDGIHRNRIIHKDIKPANILINPTTFEVKIIDFSIASLLPKEVKQLTNPDLLEGTLAYLSPEQTGRMNRALDYRTDFYSLGITFYELLTGTLPFTTNDPIELIYCHLAKIAKPIQSINSNIPDIICEIVHKLMAKNAEARYQSALGLKHDLELCLLFWQQGQIAPFELAQKDISDRFLIPEKLYGRETYIETLLAAFERISIPPQSPLNKGGSNGVEMVLVTGFSGVGKTAVVNEVHKPIVKNRGYFINGKFDQFQRDIPFAALVQAFRNLIGQLLSESETKIEYWKTKILAALGEQGQVIIDIIPELEIITGKQPQVQELSFSAAQNRFNLLFQNFVYIFAVPEHPLVIFIDDLQWADAASLKLIQLLMTGANISSNRSTAVLPEDSRGSTAKQDIAKSLLLIGAYRDNEVDESHPLDITIKEIQKTGTIVNYITLEPLAQKQLNSLIADTLHHQEVDTTVLTQMVFAKTKGNPFFVNQFLKYLYNEKAIQFNSETVRWEYELDKVQALSFTDDVVEFMAKELEKLPLPTQNLLKYAACISNEFDLKTLAIINQESLEDVTAKLWDALLEGLIISNQECHKFVHDRVQQAAYSLISEDEKQSTHLKIGNLLLQNTPIFQREEKIFELVKHFNVAIDLITDQATRFGLAEMNLIAGRRAMTSTAYSAAFNYLTTGIDLLAEKTWEKYELTLALYETAAEAAYLSGEFERAEQFIETVLLHAKTLLEKIKVYEVKIQAYGAQNNALKAVKTGLIVLKELGVDLAENPTQLDVQLAITETSSRLLGKKIEDLIHLPEMREALPLAAMTILSSITALAYQISLKIFTLIIIKQINICLEWGNCQTSPFSYVTYGLILSGVFEDIESGYQFGKLGESLLFKFHTKHIFAKVIAVFNQLIKHWKEHSKNTLNFLLQAYSIGLEAGDLEFAAYGLYAYSYTAYFTGQELKLLETEVAKYSNIIRQIKQERIFYWNEIYRQTILNLLGSNDNKVFHLVGEAYQEDKMLTLHQESNDGVALFFSYFCKLQLCYLFGEYYEAIENASNAEKFIYAGTGMSVTPQFYFYDSLARLAAYENFNESQQEEIQNKVYVNQSKMEKWANHAPMNYSHKLYLIQAECHRINNRYLEAINFYEHAISLAQEHGYINDEALANELASKFYIAWGKKKIAQVYMTDAYYCYIRWGAKAKVDDLLKRYPQLLAHIIEKETFSPPSIRDSNSLAQISLSTNNQQTIISSYTSISKYLDIATIIKASQALSQKIEFSELLSTLIQIVMENAGASKCALILVEGEDSGLVVSATGASSVSTSVSCQFPSMHLDDSEDVPISLINYVKRTKEIFVFDDARDVASLTGDSYIIRTQPKSLLCTPITNQGKLLGILYLENNVTVGTFTRERIQILNLLTTQAAISLENARLYKNLAEANQSLENYNHTLEEKVEARTQELNSKNQHLEQALYDLRSTQTQLIQSEKMSSLGQMVAGIAHEINNPINFIHGNIAHASNYVCDLINLIALYQQEYSPTLQIQEKHEEIDIDFLAKDLSKILDSMKIGSSRIRDIVLSLRNFSRLDEAEMKHADIHEGIDNTLMILQHQLKTKSYRPEIEVIKEYGVVPKINCYPGQLNQVFMNILSNGIDALDELAYNIQYSNYKPQIRICTELIDVNWVQFRIIDNGCGISQEVIKKIFDPFFSTKTVGNGTGLGLSISYEIIVNKHKGKLTCNSKLGQGTEFVIEIPT
ncbi:multi-sensor signal transduction multi-kinase [Calothrix sp. NIES-4071]|nr:multi-sensor signal transduction multi-kinase [Calothrix sp. NIES-4071]BAZ56647.1 multi-sensor signal transduction multi-kinase [Calothrix sp. NIES-4105]